jgi:hypothetical protein
MNVTIFLLLSCLAPWPHLSNAHCLLLTAVPCVSVSVNSNTALLHEHYMNSTTAIRAALDGGASKAAMCRTFGGKRTMLYNALTRHTAEHPLP